MPNKKKSRVEYLLTQLKGSKDGTMGGTPVDKAAHLSYMDTTLKSMIPDVKERGDVQSMLAGRRLRGESAKEQADAIEKMSDREMSFGKGGKMKFNKKYTAGSSNVAKRKKLMAQIAEIYKKYRGTKANRKKKGFPPAVEARLKKLMAERDRL